jgi:elongation factor G
VPLEPIMKVEVVALEALVAPVIRDLNLRRAQTVAQDARRHAYAVNAMVPLMNMFGYAEALRSLSEGRATFTMQFDRYAPAPPFAPSDDPPFRPATGMRA